MSFWDDDVKHMDAFAEAAMWDDGQRMHRVKLAAFDNAWLAAEFMQTDVDAVGPAAHVATASVPGIAIGHTLTVNNEMYQVIGVEPDGNGLTRLRLSKDS